MNLSHASLRTLVNNHITWLPAGLFSLNKNLTKM